VVRQAVLAVVGVSRVHLGDPVLAVLKEVSNQVHGGDSWTPGLPWASLVARRDVPVTVLRCTVRGCTSPPFSVVHPLPDLATVRCPAHRADEEAHAA
jgi:hypothetical protein